MLNHTECKSRGITLSQVGEETIWFAKIVSFAYMSVLRLNQRFVLEHLFINLKIDTLKEMNTNGKNEFPSITINQVIF